MAAGTEVGHGAAELYERHSSRVFGYCLSRLGGREDAEDAMQLTFLHAVRGLRRGVVPDTESAWLLAIARNVCLSRWASASRRNRLESACDPTELERLTSAPDPRRDELIGLEEALELLPEQQRRAVLLRDWRGLSYEEVAARLGVSHAAVETLIFRGRAALANHLGEQAGEPRRRLRSLAGLGSLFNSVKGAFTGAAAGAKLAAGVTAVVAVSGGGVALATAVVRAPGERPAHAVPHATPDAAVAEAAVAPPTAATSSGSSASRGTASARTAAPAAVAAPGTPALPSDDASDMPVEPAAPVAAPAVATSSPAGGAGTGASDEASAAPQVSTPALAIPTVEAAVVPPLDDVPSLPSVELPSTETVVAATEPVTTAADETLATVPAPPATVPALPLPAPSEPAKLKPLLP